jgi:hypothetical protein
MMARKRKSGVTWETIHEIASKLPGAEEGTSYGTPAFRVRGKLFVRLHQDGDCVVVPIDFEERTMRMQADPHAFFITDHYLRYPYMLVRFGAVGKIVMRELLEDAWRRFATNKLIAEFDAAKEC